jgi:hypothetical protein
MMMIAESLSRPPTNHDGTSFVSASVATQSHASPAIKLAHYPFSSWLDAATFVIAGLDPAIHRFEWTLFFEMDARVKPAHDESIEMENALVRAGA